VTANINKVYLDLEIKSIDNAVDRVLKEGDDVTDGTLVLVHPSRSDECGPPSPAIHTFEFQTSRI